MTGALAKARRRRVDPVLDSGLQEVLKRLEDFRAVHGHLFVPTSFACDDGFRLGLWVARRRSEARRGELHSRYGVLNEVAGWDWEPCDPRLVAGFERLRVYVEKYGSARVPLWYVCEDGFRLGVWVRSRRAHPSGCAWLNEALERMPCWRVSRRGVPPRWRSDRVIDEELLRRLEEFRSRHGRVPVARRYRCDDGFRLGEWLRSCLARGPGRHEMLRRGLAQDVWPIRTSATFRNEAVAHLWGYVREHGTASVGASYVCVDGFRLGSWVHRRRRRRGADRELDAVVESLPGWTWEPREESFRERVRVAREAALVGRLRSDRRLSAWVHEQERAVRSGRLDRAHVELLRQAGLIDVHLHLC